MLFMKSSVSTLQTLRLSRKNTLTPAQIASVFGRLPNLQSIDGFLEVAQLLQLLSFASQRANNAATSEEDSVEPACCIGYPALSSFELRGVDFDYGRQRRKNISTLIKTLTTRSQSRPVEQISLHHCKNFTEIEYDMLVSSGIPGLKVIWDEHGKERRKCPKTLPSSPTSTPLISEDDTSDDSDSDDSELSD